MFSVSEILKHPGVIAMFIILGILLFVFVPFMISRARKGYKTSRNYIPDLIRMSGLQQSSQSDFSGNFQGFQTILRFGLGVNYPDIAYQTMKGMSGGKSNYHSRSIVWQKYYVEMELQKEISPIILKERVGILRTDQFILEKIADRDIELPEIKTNSKLKRVRIFGTDYQLAEKIASDYQLQKMISNWHFTDIRIMGTRLYFSMDDNMINPTFGPVRSSKPQFIIDGLNISARLAQLASV